MRFGGVGGWVRRWEALPPGELEVVAPCKVGSGELDLGGQRLVAPLVG